MANSFKNSRFVVVVGKKVAKTSVQRHLLKRRLWAILDKMDKSKFKEQTDFAFFVKTTFISTDIPEIKQQVEVCVLK
jgi:ribonuclease P protein component